MYRARQKNGSQVARIVQARPDRSGKQQQEQNSRNLGTVFLPGPVYVQGWAKVRFPGSVNRRGKSCVFLPAAGRRTQLFPLIFTEPG